MSAEQDVVLVTGDIMYHVSCAYCDQFAFASNYVIRHSLSQLVIFIKWHFCVCTCEVEVMVAGRLLPPTAVMS